MRRAVGKPGHLAGDVARHSLGRITIAMPFIVGKKAQAPDGTTVTFTISGQTAIVLSIKVAGGRASSVDPPPKTPTVQLSMDFETFSCLGCGRWDPTETLLSGKVKVVGDTELGETIIKQMNFMP
ncbi:SCP2 sterol-binding domain-containing protein [Dehalococcoidia bacterium]|nr:SCP2 sterol-binding domain-containing protein [Dehalococcoidia bacterium]